MVDCETKRLQAVDGCKRLPATAVRPRRPAIIDVTGYDTAESGMLVAASLATTTAGCDLNVVAAASASSISMCCAMQSACLSLVLMAGSFRAYYYQQGHI